MTDYSTLDNAELDALCAEILGIPIADRAHSIRWAATAHCEDFEDIKREIERRGWGWASRYEANIDDRPPHVFAVLNHPSFWVARDASESRAGCIAFLRAVEATK